MPNTVKDCSPQHCRNCATRPRNISRFENDAYYYYCCCHHYCCTLGTASLGCLSSNIKIDISGNSSSISSSSQVTVELAVSYTARVSRICDVVRDGCLLIYASNYTVFFSLLLQIKGYCPAGQYYHHHCLSHCVSYLSVVTLRGVILAVNFCAVQHGFLCMMSSV